MSVEMRQCLVSLPRKHAWRDADSRAHYAFYGATALRCPCNNAQGNTEVAPVTFPPRLNAPGRAAVRSGYMERTIKGRCETAHS